MSTYSQVLNELRQNNWKTLNSIKTRNLDIAKFESQRLQEQGRLLNLAGKFGADLMEKWGTKIEQDRENLKKSQERFENAQKEFETEKSQIKEQLVSANKEVSELTKKERGVEWTKNENSWPISNVDFHQPPKITCFNQLRAFYYSNEGE